MPSSGPSPTSIDDLLAAMTWEEKLAQLQIGYRPRLEDARALVRQGIGAVFWPRDAAATNELQRVAREETPHGIPLLVGLDVVHGQRTIFPVPIAQASSFDPAVAETDARVSAAEAASGGVTWTFSPMVDVSRDPRWGRVVEGFGEDAYLTGVFGAAKVRGYQGTSLADRDAILACAKHFVAYGQPEGGRDYNTVDVSGPRLRNVYLPPFRAAVDAGVATVMAAFNTVSGRPAHANRGLLTGILKEEWGFDGVVVGDAEGVVNLIAHGVATDLPDALVQALSAGLDVEMGANVVAPDGTAAVAPSALDIDRVDDAVRRVLRLKVALGLFDDPSVPVADEITRPSPAARVAAREAAERSMVLLRNDGTLPLPPTRRRVLLVGPYAESNDHLGAWVQSFAEPAGTLADALRARCPEWDLTVLPGAAFLGDEPGLRAAAASAAREHDVVVVAVGEPSDLTGEASSRSDLRLPGDQEDLVHAIANSGTPFAVVLVNGRPLVTSGWISRAPAVLEAWHGGTEAPAAIARVLVGDVSPAGRLPMSFPRSVGQIPVHYDHESTGRPPSVGGTLRATEHDIGLHGPDNTDDRYTSKYRDLDLGPEFAFGHGLSYTSFEYSGLGISPGSLSVDELAEGRRFEVTVRVANVGARSGDEVTTVFVRDLVASLAPPVRRLRAFTRTPLGPGEGRTLRFTLGRDDLGFWGADDEYVVEPGEVDVHVGGGLGDTLGSRLTVMP